MNISSALPLLMSLFLLFDIGARASIAAERHDSRVQEPSQKVLKANRSVHVHPSHPKTKSPHVKFHKPIVHKSPHTAPKSPPSPTGYLNPKSYGAVGDGVHDDQAAINAAIAAARATGKGVYFSAGNYLHSSVIVANAVALLGAGPTLTTLTASEPRNCAVELAGNNPSFRNFNIHGVYFADGGGFPTDTRPQEAAIWANAASNFMVVGNTVTGSAGGNGIDVIDCTTGTISNNVIANVHAGGMNMWGCSNVQVVNNSVQNPFGFALCVATGLKASENITFANNLFQGAANGFGIYLNSMQTCSFTNNNCTTHPLFLFNEEGTSAPSSNLLVSSNTFNGTQAYGIYAASPRNGFDTNLTITKNTITNVLSPSFPQGEIDAIRIQQVQGANISNNTIAGSAAVGIAVTGCSNVTIDSNMLSNIAWESINVSDILDSMHNSGSMDISNNQMSGVCTGNIRGGSDIVVGGLTAPNFLYTSLSIVGNTLSGPANGAGYFIDCTVPSNDGVTGFTRTISGNTQKATTLPNNIAP